MKIYLYYNNKIKVFYLPEDVSGSFGFDVSEEDTAKLINIDARDGKWILHETEFSKVSNGIEFIKEVALTPYSFYVVCKNHKNYLIYVTYANENESINAYSYTNSLSVVVGGESPSAFYNCPYNKDLNFRIDKKSDGQLLLQVKYGRLYINNILLNSSNYYIKNSDELELFGVKIIFLQNMFIVISSNQIFHIDEAKCGVLKANLVSDHNFKNVEIQDKNLFEEEDYFSKAPRIRRMIEDKKIEVSAPPNIEKDGEMPAILTIGPMLTMGVSSVVMMSSSISGVVSGEVDFKDASSSIIIGVVMLVSTLLWPLLTNAYQKRSRKKRNASNIKKYHKYLASKKKELENEVNLEKEIITENVISIEDCIENLQHKKLNFWDKRIDQNDFLVVRLGVGDELLKAKVEFHEEEFSIDDDQLKDEASQIVNQYKYVPNVPIGYSLYENITTAIMGDNQVKCHYFVNNIVFQLLTFYSYDDLKLVIFTNENNESYWDYVKYLNHNMTNDSAFRFFASNEESAAQVTDILRQELANRMEQVNDSNGKSSLFRPYYLVIVDDLEVVKKTNFIDQLTEIKANIGFSTIIMETKLSKLPSLCNNFINVGDNTSGILKNSYEKQERLVFKDEVNYKIDMMEVAKILANIPIEIANNTDDVGELPDSVTFLEMARVGKVEQLNIMNRWKTNDSTTNLKAEVGVGTDGKLMYLDLHEKAHGPHGLIAGMTGSGKSEFIITWILSLCMNFSPEDVAFILIDYKGGGLAFAFENQATGMRLPHLAGTITNLDKAEINRTLVSIDSEVKRRQRIFNDARDKLGESTIDIYKYQGFYHDGKLDEALPHLFIVCDEFAELKAQQPDFMDNLISVARIGRSLGVHLILATQKPSGVVNDQIWSNTKFRVCLKVQDASDSNEMLKKPDAASLKQAGRFYLQVGYDEYYALGQSGWCGAKYYPSDTIQKSVDKSVNILSETGVTIKNIQSDNASSKKGEAQGEQLAAIMKEIINVATDNDMFVKRLWLENIPDNITVKSTEEKYNFTYEKGKYSLVIGEYDAPEAQGQFPLVYDLLEDGNGNVIGTDSLEYEEAITTILYNIMLHFRPDEVSYYIIDYGSQNFLKFAKAPHCGGVVPPGDGEGFNNLLKLIMEEQKSRKKILSTFGGEYKDYVKQHPGEMPIRLVIFNNYESINEANQSLYEILGELLRDSERYGIVYFFSSSSVGSVPDRFKQLMPFTIALKLKEAGDYLYLWPGKNKIEPRNMFGRGVCFTELLHEFQIAFVCEERSEETNTLLELFDKLNADKLPKALSIPTLPEQVLLSDVQKKINGFKRLPIGIEKGTLEIRSLNFTTEIAKLIGTNKLKYTRNFIKSFIEEFITLKQNLIIFDSCELLVKTKDKYTNYVSSEFDAKIDQVNEYVGKNKDNEKHTLLIICGFSKMINKLEDPMKINELFDAFKACNNTHILIVDETNKLKENLYEDWFKNIDVSEGLYIGLGVEENGVLKISNYSKELSATFPRNYGFYISEGNYHIVKLLEFEKDTGDEDDEE